MEDKVQNAELLIDIFGKFPSFHDAEVWKITLNRKVSEKPSPTLEALIYVYSSGKKCLVNLEFTGFFGLKLENFNHQNALGDLEIREITEPDFNEYGTDARLLGVTGKNEIQRLKFYVKFHYCFGVEAEFLCSSVSVASVEPVDY
ncbi:MAG TPA: Imm50 family immunity protein [Pyrinomonadaceae bacterium]